MSEILPLKPDDVTLKKIGDYILDGLSEKEACILSDFPYPDFSTLKKNVPGFANYFNKRKIEFKHTHLKNINSKKSDKTSQWMLEKILPEEFGSSRAKDPGNSINIINNLIRDVQRQDQNLIKIHDGQEENQRQQLKSGDPRDHLS